jgi:uncharacterized membrane protein YfcA
VPDLPVLIFALALVAASSTLQGTTGFGYNILVVPLLALFIDPKVVVPTVILQNVLLDSAVLATAWRQVDVRRVWLLVAAGLAGTPIGVLLLGVVDPEPLRLLIGLVVVFTGVAMLAGLKRTISDERMASGVAGAAGGMMNGLVGMAGPPVILLFANQGMPPLQFRANIVTYFTSITVIAVASFWLRGALTHDVTELTAATMPAVALGVLAGIRLHGRVPVELFHRMSLVLVIIAGASATIIGLLRVVGV